MIDYIVYLGIEDEADNGYSVTWDETTQLFVEWIVRDGDWEPYIIGRSTSPRFTKRQWKKRIIIPRDDLSTEWREAVDRYYEETWEGLLEGGTAHDDFMKELEKA